MSRNQFLLPLLFILLWNSGFIGAEYGLPYTGPFTLMFWRYGALTLILFIYLLITKRLCFPGWPITIPNMLVGLLAHGVWLTGVLFSLNLGVPAGIVALITALQPMATGAFSRSITGERTSRQQWAGLVIAFVGVALTVFARIDFSDLQSAGAYLIPFISVVAMTSANLIEREMEIAEHWRILPMDQTLFYQSFATFLAFIIPAFLFENFRTQWESPFILTMMWLIVPVSIGAYASMWKLLERMEANRFASLFYFSPPVTMLMAWMAFGDTLLLTDVGGLIIVFSGVLFTQKHSTPNRQ
ncbi:DMT family transporter [Marinilabilia salmonicolor]|uniref:DMT family transporter n=1 Tax=Marinilabilia salmonicolor TaxID=989 RepID=UPI00029B519F|nr:DMT family transporter [Marinilabilia salmonicolor]